MTARERARLMPHVVIAGMAARRFTGGLGEFEVEADTVRRMIAELERRFPGLGHQIDEGMAVAIDGEIFQDAYLAPLNPDSEIVLIPKIGGG
jgi:sulfur-carrier protein